MAQAAATCPLCFRHPIQLQQRPNTMQATAHLTYNPGKNNPISRFLASQINNKIKVRFFCCYLFVYIVLSIIFYIVLIRSHNLTSGSCSPVPGNIAPILPSTATAEENDLYLMGNPYDYRSNNSRAYNHNTNNSSYHLYNNNNNSSGGAATDHYSSSPYDNASTTSPYVQQRKLHHSVIDHIAADKEPYHYHEEQRRNSIDLPTSPPPEGLKYSSASSSVWPDVDTTSAAAAAVDRKDAPLGIF